MNTTPVKYVGPREEYEDVLFGTGWWKKSEVKQVRMDVAPFMLNHPDVYADARTAAARKKDPIKPMERPTTYKQVREDRELPLANLAMMDKQGLSRYAEMNFQHRFDYDNTTVQQMRAEIVGLMRERA